MIVGTTEAAKILKISTARLRTLLIEGRVEGAYKSGRIWLIPLFAGKPIIEKGKRGPAPRWRNPRVPAKAVIHVNAQKIKYNFLASVPTLNRNEVKIGWGGTAY